MRSHLPIIMLACLAMFVGCAEPGQPATTGATSSSKTASSKTKVRFATYNASLNRGNAGKLISDLAGGTNDQAKKVAQIIQKIRPDVLLLNEFDFDEAGEALKLFREEYVAKANGDLQGIVYPYAFVAPVNTGVDSGVDINQDGEISLPDDGFGFGRHPGQFGMVVLSNYPINAADVRSFQNFLWQDLPGAMLPKKDGSDELYYDAGTLAKLRLSSKSHWDVPVKIGDEVVHLLASHPTPPVFDGPEDRNGCRNHDEIRFWAEYVGGKADFAVDDAGKKGGLATDARFVIAGDLNADPNDGESNGHPARQLTENPLIQDPLPISEGAVEQSEKQGEANARHTGPAAHDTGDFNDRSAGNLRVDYVLPSANQTVISSGVFWPKSDDPDFELAGASDHRLVWVDILIDQP